VSGGVVVTGGTGALGSVLVRLLLEEGRDVAVPYRSPSSWEGLRKGVPSPDGLWGDAADLADLVEARRFMDAAAKRFGGIRGVAALAGGFAASGTLEATPDAEWEGMMRTNLQSARGACVAALPHLLRDGGSVVTVISRSAEAGGPGAAAYATSKMAVLALTRALSLENRGRGVRFNAVSPGTIDTAANRAAMPKADTSLWTPPEEIARVILWLLSRDSEPITGAVLPF
jgi:NAD(P)-dependent dehydrogenase (short-subunit alcohol dehydrogenase family)